MKFDAATYRLTEAQRPGQIGLIVGLIGLVAGGAGYWVDSQQFFFSYLVAFVFWFTFAAGGLFFVLLHHLVSATWSVVVRRMAESVMGVFPYLALLFIPIIFGIHDLFHWSHAEAVANDTLLQYKAPYLNIGFFGIRAGIYFSIWMLLSFLLRRNSLKQDNGGFQNFPNKMAFISAPGMIAFALTLTFASFDWIMSLDPHWYSTIFGVYIFSGCVVSIFAFMIIVFRYLRKREVLKESVTLEHYHDMGKMLFAFMVFWAYMAFSQYFIIWYGNVPEETIWFLNRWEGSWKAVSLLLVFGNFGLPFFIMITRVAKRADAMMLVMAVWLLVMHWVDIYWLIMPTLHKHGFHLSWMDAALTIGIGGMFFFFFWNQFIAHPIVPVGDPKLKASIKSLSH